MEFGNLLDSLSDDAPSGIELRNDRRFHAIERLLEPMSRDNRLRDDGALDESAEDVDWQEVAEQGLALAGEGRDLRLLVILTRAATGTEGFAGLARGLQLLTDTLDQYWDSLHPALRERDDPKAAALPRINALMQLENDDNGLLGDLKYSHIFSMPGVGAIAGRDLANASLSEFEYLNRAASGLSEKEKAEIKANHEARINRINAACRALCAEKEDVARALLDGIAAAEAGIAALCAKTAEKGEFGAEPGLSLPELSEFLGQCRASLEAGQAAISGDATETAAQDDAAAAAPSAAARAATPGPNGPVAAPVAINSRSDVVRSLDAIIAFYERTEPSSPIPHLARRMRRMVPMDFLELMEEIAPSGLKEFGNIAGVESKKK